MGLVEYAERLDTVGASIIVGFSLIFVSIIAYINGETYFSDVSAHLGLVVFIFGLFCLSQR